jgi:hypothetical protein
MSTDRSASFDQKIVRQKSTEAEAALEDIVAIVTKLPSAGAIARDFSKEEAVEKNVH